MKITYSRPMQRPSIFPRRQPRLWMKTTTMKTSSLFRAVVFVVKYMCCSYVFVLYVLVMCTTCFSFCALLPPP